MELVRIFKRLVCWDQGGSHKPCVAKGLFLPVSLLTKGMQGIEHFLEGRAIRSLKGGQSPQVLAWRQHCRQLVRHAPPPQTSKEVQPQILDLLTSSIERDDSGLFFLALPPSEGLSQGEEADGHVPGQKRKEVTSGCIDTNAVGAACLPPISPRSSSLPSPSPLPNTRPMALAGETGGPLCFLFSAF